MSDRISGAHRSWNMAQIRGSDTEPEKKVRSLLHRLGYRFRLHPRGLPGRPDVVLPKHHAVVFVNGCFWHRHPRCKFAYKPKTNISFWAAKFAANVERDRRTTRRLRSLGWRVIVVWECELRDPERLARRLRRLVPRPDAR